MNTATKTLENDHVHILKLIDVMEQVTYSDEPDTDHIEKILSIIRNFADGLHHAREEEIFFPLLAERGFSATQGPVAVMLHEHEQGRNFVRGIAGSIELYKKGNKSAANDIYANMMGYAGLLRNHISKENNILFKMADKALSESDQTNLTERFAEAEKNHAVKTEEFVTQIRELASVYNLI